MKKEILLNKIENNSEITIFKNEFTTNLCDNKKRKVIFMICWPSWVWKDSIVNRLLSDHEELFTNLISTVTRPKRDWEIEWNPYYFVSREEFDTLIKEDKLFEYSTNYDEFYWYTYTETKRVFDTNKNPICIINEDWVEQLQNKTNSEFDIFKIFILPPSIDELKNRKSKRDLNNKNLSKEELEKKIIIMEERLKKDLEWIEKVHNSNFFDWIIINYDLESSIKLVYEIFYKVINWTL